MLSTTHQKAERFLIELLNAVPPLHYTDYAFVAELISLGSEKADTLRKKGYVLAKSGYRTTKADAVIDASSRFKSAVIGEMLCAVIEWEDTHNFEEGELDPDGVIDILTGALINGRIPYTKAYMSRQAEVISVHCPNIIGQTDIEQAGIYLDFWDSRNKNLYLHLLDDTKSVSKAKLRTYLIKLLGEAFQSAVNTEIFTDDPFKVGCRYFKMEGTHITTLTIPYSAVPYFSFIRSLTFFIGN